MKLDNIWKHPFHDPNTNKIIAQLSYQSILQVIKTGKDFNLFYENSTEEFKNFSDFNEHSDLSAINKILKFNCANIINQQTSSLLKDKVAEDTRISFFIKNPRITNIYRICEYLAKIKKMPDSIAAKLFYKDQRYSELNQIISFLILYRNYSAHGTKERNDLGLCLSVGSKLLRYTELLELDHAWTKSIQNLREVSIKIIKDTFLYDPTDEMNSQTIIDEKTDQNKLMIEISNNINFIKDNLINPKNQTFDNNFIDDNLNNEELIEERLDDYNLYGEENLTVTQLKQKLLELRKIISKEFELTKDEQNILSKENIDGIILLGVTKQSEWKKITSVNHNYSSNRKIMDKQIDEYWPRINDLLSSFNWFQDN